jgi:hypothetical protein
MRLFMTLLFLVTLAPFSQALAQQQVDPHDRQMLTFYFHTSSQQDAALDKFAHDELTKAEQAGRPVEPRVAMLPGMILISLESVTICNTKIGCPLLIFRDITKLPTLKDSSYQNISITQTAKGTFLYLRDGDGDKQCLIPKSGKARCTRPAKKP